MSFPTEDEIKKTNDAIATLVCGWAGRIEALAAKYKIRGEQWLKCPPHDPGHFRVSCEVVNGVRMWGAFYYLDGEDPREIQNCRLTVKLHFLEAALILETQYLNEVKAFYERAEKIIASQGEKKAVVS